MIAKDSATARRAEIDMGKARAHSAGVAAAGSPHTTHLTVADADGNVVAATQTINSLFGSRAMAPGTGMLLNNTMALFDPHPGHALSVAPGKRMTSSMAPTIVLRDGRPALALGLPGGTRIFGSVLQTVVNVVDHGMSLQEAVEAPRVWTQGQELEVEPAVSAAVRDDLAGRGAACAPSRSNRTACLPAPRAGRRTGRRSGWVAATRGRACGSGRIAGGSGSPCAIRCVDDLRTAGRIQILKRGRSLLLTERLK